MATRTRTRRLEPVVSEESAPQPSAEPRRATTKAARRPASLAQGARPSAKTAPAAIAPVAAAAPAPEDTPEALVRDRFTMPAADFALIKTLKKRCVGLGVSMKKSELLRAGLQALSRLSDVELTAAVAGIERTKTRRRGGDGKDRDKGTQQ